MASRLMLSLKKASVEQKPPWSLRTMSNPNWGPITFASNVLRTSHQISSLPTTLDELDVELDVVSTTSLSLPGIIGRGERVSSVDITPGAVPLERNLFPRTEK